MPVPFEKKVVHIQLGVGLEESVAPYVLSEQKFAEMTNVEIQHQGGVRQARGAINIIEDYRPKETGISDPYIQRPLHLWSHKNELLTYDANRLYSFSPNHFGDDPDYVEGVRGAWERCGSSTLLSTSHGLLLMPSGYKAPNFPTLGIEKTVSTGNLNGPYVWNDSIACGPVRCVVWNTQTELWRDYRETRAIGIGGLPQGEPLPGTLYAQIFDEQTGTMFDPTPLSASAFYAPRLLITNDADTLEPRYIWILFAWDLWGLQSIKSFVLDTWDTAVGFQQSTVTSNNLTKELPLFGWDAVSDGRDIWIVTNLTQDSVWEYAQGPNGFWFGKWENVNDTPVLAYERFGNAALDGTGSDHFVGLCISSDSTMLGVIYDHLWVYGGGATFPAGVRWLVVNATGASAFQNVNASPYSLVLDALLANPNALHNNDSDGIIGAACNAGSNRVFCAWTRYLGSTTLQDYETRTAYVTWTWSSTAVTIRTKTPHTVLVARPWCRQRENGVANSIIGFTATTMGYGAQGVGVMSHPVVTPTETQWITGVLEAKLDLDLHPVTTGSNVYRYGIHSPQSVSEDLTPWSLQDAEFPYQVRNNSATIYCGSVRIAYLDMNSQLSHNTAETGSVLSISCGCPVTYDSHEAQELGFGMRPAMSFTDESSGSYWPAATYNIVAHYTYRDADGNISFGPLSDVYTFMISKASLGINWTVPSTMFRPLDGRKTVQLWVYANIPATDPGTYYLSATPTATWIASATTGWINTLNPAAPTGAERTLYTTGYVMENAPSPSMRHIVSHANRMFGIHAEFTDQIWYTKTIVPLEFPSWTYQNVVVVQPTDDCKALCSFEDKLLIFSTRRVYALVGEYPDDTGNNGNVGTPQIISHEVGIQDWRSVLRVQVGVMFRSESMIWLIDNGLNLTPVGMPVMEKLRSYPTVRGACWDEASKEARFLVCVSDSDLTGVMLCYNTAFGQWTVHDWNDGEYDTGGS